jgi:hypothetical protein
MMNDERADAERMKARPSSSVNPEQETVVGRPAPGVADARKIEKRLSVY